MVCMVVYLEDWFHFVVFCLSDEGMDSYTWIALEAGNEKHILSESRVPKPDGLTLALQITLHYKDTGKDI